MSQQTNTEQPDVRIYVDGHAVDGAGGYGAVLISHSGKTTTRTGASQETTAAHMELLAINSALDLLQYPCAVEIYSDSKNIVNGGNEWIYRWVKNGWRTSSRRIKTHLDGWKTLLDALNRHDITFIHVPADEEDDTLQRADQLARDTRNRALLDLLNEQTHVFLLAGPADPTPKMKADARTLVDIISRLPDTHPETYTDESKPWLLVSDRTEFDQTVIEAANERGMTRIAVVGPGSRPHICQPSDGYYIQRGRGYTDQQDSLTDIATHGYFIHDDSDRFIEQIYQTMQASPDTRAVMWHRYTE